MSEEDSCYSNDQQYFMDLCRANDFQELKQFITSLPQNSEFNWEWFNKTGDNFIHMIAANNFPDLFDYLLPIMVSKCPKEQVSQILNKQNSSLSTPLHYAVVTDSKDMVKKLLQAGANPQIANQSNRTPLQEAEKFEKFQVAEILAPVTKTDFEALRKQIGDVNLNDSSDQQQQLPTIEQKLEQKIQQPRQQKLVEKTIEPSQVLEKKEKIRQSQNIN